MRRAAAWAGTGALVVLGARQVTYALSPSPLAGALEGKAGGPRLPVLAVVSLGLGLAVAAAAVWLAALGVRERRLLESRPVLADARLRLGLLAARAVGLWLATMLGFALFESYIHWRAGLGWHGLHCLTGPAHRDAIPILGALSLIAAALAAALDHVLAWMRRTLARLVPTHRQPSVVCLPRPLLELAPRPAVALELGARGPPTRS
jgi:hypothetical protein